MVIGRYNNVLDEKHRIRVNPAFKPEFTGELVLIMSVNGCISVYTKERFREMIGGYVSVGTFDAKAQAAYTALLSTAYETATDKQDRILLPENLLRYAGIAEVKDGKTVVKNQVSTVGKVDHLEIWSTERLDAFSGSMSFEEMFATLNTLEEKPRLEK